MTAKNEASVLQGRRDNEALPCALCRSILFDGGAFVSAAGWVCHNCALEACRCPGADADWRRRLSAFMDGHRPQRDVAEGFGLACLLFPIATLFFQVGLDAIGSDWNGCGVAAFIGGVVAIIGYRRSNDKCLSPAMLEMVRAETYRRNHRCQSSGLFSPQEKCNRLGAGEMLDPLWHQANVGAEASDREAPRGPK